MIIYTSAITKEVQHLPFGGQSSQTLTAIYNRCIKQYSLMWDFLDLFQAVVSNYQPFIRFTNT